MLLFTLLILSTVYASVRHGNKLYNDHAVWQAGINVKDALSMPGYVQPMASFADASQDCRDMMHGTEVHLEAMANVLGCKVSKFSELF